MKSTFLLQYFFSNHNGTQPNSCKVVISRLPIHTFTVLFTQTDGYCYTSAVSG